MTSPIDQIRRYHGELTAIRQDIHANPELGLEEHRTADLVARKLEEWGIEVHRGVGTTGVVGVLRSGNGEGTIGLRADMDALPIVEANDFAYRSRNPGKMHACGHDGHTTMLLGAARYLAETRNFNGTVNFIFQPGEEGVGGALAMLNDDLFQRFPCNAVYGMHNRPGMPVGKYGISPGTAMAGGGFFDITITGKGAHGARPGGIDRSGAGRLPYRHGIAIDCVAQRVARARPRCVSVTRIHVRRRLQRDPADARRWWHGARDEARDDDAWWSRACGASSSGVAAGFGATAEVDFRLIFAPLVNHAAEMRRDRRRCGRTGRRRQRQPRAGAGVGIRGFLLHAGAGARRLHQSRQWRLCAGAQPSLQLQR